MVRLADKQKKFDQYLEDWQNSKVAVFAEYRGLSVAQLTDLRGQLFKQDAKFTVVKNTIFLRALKQLGEDKINHQFTGPIAVLMGFSDEVPPVKTLKGFLAKAKIGEIKGGYLEGAALTANEVKDLAELPPIDELRGKLVGAINSPLAGLVGALNSPARSLVYVLDQVAKQKEANG